MGTQVKQPSFQFKPFSKQQLRVLTWWTDASPVHKMDGIIADGSIRSGKTVCMSLSFVMWAMETFNGQTFAMCGKTIGSFRRNVLSPMRSMLPAMGYDMSERVTDNLVTIQHGGRVNRFYIFGGTDESSAALIQGITLAGVLFDEVALMPESFVIVVWLNMWIHAVDNEIQELTYQRMTPAEKEAHDQSVEDWKKHIEELRKKHGR